MWNNFIKICPHDEALFGCCSDHNLCTKLFYCGRHKSFQVKCALFNQLPILKKEAAKNKARQVGGIRSNTRSLGHSRLGLRS
jgi:hypothetical protein